MRNKENLAGRKFGRLTVVSLDSIGINGGQFWKCLCACGTYKVFSTQSAKAYKSCGCGAGKVRHGKSVEIGERFGRLVVLERVGLDKKRNQVLWKCICDCGNITIKTVGKTKAISCGCISKEISLVAKRRGIEYKKWVGMIHRCYDEGSRYKNRGIKVCSRWRENFEFFLEDMGRQPQSKHSLDRIDNNGHYSCGKCSECITNKWGANCRWATRSEQQRNKNNNFLVMYKGETKPLVYWAKMLGMNWETLAARIKNGWTIEEAFSLPVDPKKRSRKTRLKSK